MDFKVEPIQKVSQCNNGYYWDPITQPECLTVGYSLIGDSSDINDPKYKRYHDLMKIFAKQNDFKMDKDVRALTAGKQKNLFDYIDSHLNQTHFIVTFCHDEWQERLEFETIDKS